MRKHLLPPCLLSLCIAGAASVPKRHSTGGAASLVVPSASIVGMACNFPGMRRCLTEISAFAHVKLGQRNISPKSSTNLAVFSPFSSFSVASSCLRRPCTFPHFRTSHVATIYGGPPLLLPAEPSRCLSRRFAAKETNTSFFFSGFTRCSAKSIVSAAASCAPLARRLSVWPASASAATSPAVLRTSASCEKSSAGGISESSFFPSRAAQPPAFAAASICSPAAPLVLENHALPLGEHRILKRCSPALAGRPCAVFCSVSVRSTCSAVPSTMPPAGQEEYQAAPHERLSDGESTAGEAPTLRPPASPELKRQRRAEPPKRALETEDEELYELIRLEKKRQIEGLELIASENFTSQAVKECLGSCLTNKYSEGYPGARYYGGNQIIDKIESLCQRRALEAFGLDANEWAVNVQPYSGSPANMAVYVGLLQAHDRIMGLDLPSGGHLTHGFYTAKKRVSATSIFFESLPYGVSEASGLIDYEELRRRALLFRPKLIICGHSAYPRDLDYAAFRSIADAVGAVLMCDMAHTSGLIAAGLLASPFHYCDVVTTTTHKSLRGPRSGMIFMNKKRLEDVEARINNAVFPALQGGPHDNSIAAVACQLREVRSDNWREYAKQVIQNAKALAKRLTELGHRVVTGGTDNHLLVVDLRVDGITGAKMQLCCEEANISVNKNSVPGDTAAANPSGVRLGSPALTSRGMTEEHFEQIGTWLHEVIAIAKEIQETHGKKIADFQKGVQDHPRLQKLRDQVVHFAKKFPMPGGDM